MGMRMGLIRNVRKKGRDNRKEILKIFKNYKTPISFKKRLKKCQWGGLSISRSKCMHHAGEKSKESPLKKWSNDYRKWSQQSFWLHLPDWKKIPLMQNISLLQEWVAATKFSLGSSSNTSKSVALLAVSHLRYPFPWSPLRRYIYRICSSNSDIPDGLIFCFILIWSPLPIVTH